MDRDVILELRKFGIEHYKNAKDPESFKDYLARVAITIDRHIKISAHYIKFEYFTLLLNDAMWIKEVNPLHVTEEGDGKYCVNMYFIKFKHMREVIIRACGKIFSDVDVEFLEVDLRKNTHNIIYWYTIPVGISDDD